MRSPVPVADPGSAARQLRADLDREVKARKRIMSEGQVKRVLEEHQAILRVLAASDSPFRFLQSVAHGGHVDVIYARKGGETDRLRVESLLPDSDLERLAMVKSLPRGITTASLWRGRAEYSPEGAHGGPIHWLGKRGRRGSFRLNELHVVPRRWRTSAPQLYEELKKVLGWAS